MATIGSAAGDGLERTFRTHEKSDHDIDGGSCHHGPLIQQQISHGVAKLSLLVLGPPNDLRHGSTSGRP